MAAVRVTVLTRDDCHLCTEAIETIERVAERSEIDVTVRIIDVDDDPELSEQYGERVPYVLIDGTPAFKYRVEEPALETKLAAAAAS